MTLKRHQRAIVVLALLVAAAVSLPAPVAAAASPSRPVLLIAIPDLRFSDLSAMPVLRAFSAYAAVGVMSVRSEGEVTRCGDGLLQLSAGTRVPSGVRPCTVDTAALASLGDRYRHSRYAARVGALGDTLADRSAGPVVAIGPEAATLLTGAGGSAVTTVGSVGDAFASRPTALAAAVDDGLYGSVDRTHAAAAVDKVITEQFRQTPLNAIVVVAGISDGPRGGPHLHPLLVAGPGYAHRELTSPTTGRTPFVQLFDVTATLLALRGVTSLPTSMSGREVGVTNSAVPALSSYVDLDRHATAALHVGHPTVTVLAALLIAVLLLAWRRRREARWLAAPLVVAAVAPTLLQLVPWWRWGAWSYVVGVALVAGVGAALTMLLARPSPRAALLLGPAVIAGVLLADQLAGSRLQLANPLGDNPLVAGRFHGMGNIAFGLTMGAIMLLAAILAAAQPNRRRAIAVATAVLAVAIVIDGAPGLGDDIGGVLAVLPAAALLVAIVAGIRITAARVAAVVVGAVVVAAGLGAIDYARPAAAQTHAGRFVGQVLHGGAWQVVHRRVDAVLGSFGNPVVTALVVIVIVAAVMRGRDRESPGMPAATAAALAVGLLGCVLNDSGIFVGAAVALAFVPPVLASRGLTAERGILDGCDHDRGRTSAAGRRDRAAPARRPRARFAPPPPRSADGAAVRARARRGRPRP